MPLYSDTLKSEARSLREQGHTYREIRTLLHQNIPKGTLSYWFRNISMPEDYYQRIKWLGKECILKAQLVNKQMLEKRLGSLREKNLDLAKAIDLSVGKLLLATLYWCEGAKYPVTQCIKFGSADPKMIKLFVSLLRMCYQVNESKFRLILQCRSDQNQIELSQFWEDISNIPLSQQYRPRIDRRSIGKPTKKPNYKGVCVVEYFDSNLQCELQFLGEYLGTDSALAQVKKQIK